MQRNFECSVCADFYIPGKKVPKTLSCGHSFCAPCLDILSKGSNFKCPKCRSDCILPDNQVDKLLTNYAILEMLESMCEECRDRPHTQRCGHCTHNLCDSCAQSHEQFSGADAKADFTTLKKLVQDLDDMVNNNKELQRIRTNGEQLIQEMTDAHKNQVQTLEQHYQQNITSIKDTMLKDTEAFLKWRDNISKAILDCKAFIDRAEINISLRTTKAESREESQFRKECEQKIDQLKELREAKKNPSTMTSHYDREEFEVMISKCSQLVTLCEGTETDTRVHMSHESKLIPDYTDASCTTTYAGSMTCPWGVCAHLSTGEIIATDVSQNQVYILTSSFQLIRRITADLCGPCGVVSDRENIFLCDFGNHRVCVTDMLGALVRQFGSRGTGKNHFRHPSGLALSASGQLYVCDESNHRVKVVDKQGSYVREFGQDTFNTECPRFLSISPDDKVAVTDYSHNIYIFHDGGQHKRTIRKTALNNIDATGLVFDNPGNLLVSDVHGGRVAVMTESGEVVGFIGSPGQDPGQLTSPQGLTVTRDGHIVVCDLATSNLQMYHVPKK